MAAFVGSDLPPRTAREAVHRADRAHDARACGLGDWHLVRDAEGLVTSCRFAAGTVIVARRRAAGAAPQSTTAVSPLWIAAPRRPRAGVQLSPYRPQSGTT